jgi:shikimate kinase
MSANLVLYGMMGVGKTTVGRALAQRLGRGFADTDDEIERWVGKPIPAIFADDGEAAFRDYEHRVVRELARFTDLVVALGGGAVLSDASVAELTLTGMLIHLRAERGVLLERLRDGAVDRPLLAGDLETRLDELLAGRTPRYNEVADVSVDASDDADAVVERLIDHLIENKDVLTPSEFEAVMR